MCDYGKSTFVDVKIPADLSHTGKEYWKNAAIDSCIADIVTALQNHGIDMRGSCCGHGKTLGNIQLQDGRVLFIKPNVQDDTCGRCGGWIEGIGGDYCYDKTHYCRCEKYEPIDV